jgi:hypothetical protein
MRWAAFLSALANVLHSSALLRQVAASSRSAAGCFAMSRTLALSPRQGKCKLPDTCKSGHAKPRFVSFATPIPNWVKKGRLTKEHNMNEVPPSFMEDVMFRAVVEEAAALTSITLFLGMIAVWAQVLGAL